MEHALDFYLSNAGYSEICQQTVNAVKTLIRDDQEFPITPVQYIKNTELLRRLYCEVLDPFLIEDNTLTFLPIFIDLVISTLQYILRGHISIDSSHLIL